MFALFSPSATTVPVTSFLPDFVRHTSEFATHRDPTRRLELPLLLRVRLLLDSAEHTYVLPLVAEVSDLPRLVQTRDVRAAEQVAVLGLVSTARWVRVSLVLDMYILPFSYFSSTTGV